MRTVSVASDHFDFSIHFISFLIISLIFLLFLLPDTFNFLNVVDYFPAHFRWGPWHPGRERSSHILGNHLKDRSFRLVHWLSITLFLRKTSQKSINVERKSYRDCSSDTLCTRVEFGRVTYWLQTLRSWKRWTHQKFTQKDSMQRKLHFHQEKWRINFSIRRWTNQTSWKRSGTENIHLDTGTSNSRRKSRRFSWRIRRVSSTTSWLFSGCLWSDKCFLAHVSKLQKPPSRWTKSGTLLADRRITPYSTEIQWRLQNYTHKLGC